MPIVVDPEASVAVLPVAIDPTSEGSGTELVINDGAPGGSGYVMHASPDLAPPNVRSIYADSYSTEGSIPTDDEPKYENRTLGLTVRVYGVTAADLQANLSALYQKLGKLNREGGTLLLTTPADTEIIFDLLPESSGGSTFDETYLRNNRCDVELSLTARPFWRAAAEVDLGTFTETSLTALIFEVLGPEGDVPALGRLVVTDLSGNDQWQVDIGVQSRYYDAATDLLIAGTDLTPLGSSTDTGTAIRNSDLIPTWQAIASAPGLTLKGSYRIKVRLRRPTGNTGEVSVRLQWAAGDYRQPALNDVVSYAVAEREGVDTWADLGVVHIPPDADHWEPRVLAKSSVVGDEIDAKDMLLFPTTEGYIELAARLTFETPSAFSARDEFDQSAGALTGKTAPLGGVWTVVTGSDAGDFQVEAAGHTAQHSSAEPAIRGVTVGTTNYTQIAVQVDLKVAALPEEEILGGLLLRNSGASTTSGLRVALHIQKVGGAYVYSIQCRTPAGEFFSATIPRPIMAAWYTLRAAIRTDGGFLAWWFPRESVAGDPVVTARSAGTDLAPGGAAATGRIGLYAVNDDPAVTMSFDNFFAFVPTFDAAIFADQSLELRHDRATREDSAGVFPSRISYPGGRYLRIPPAGREGRSTRFVVKGYRNDPVTGTDPANDDIQAQLFATPRGLVVPGV